MQKLNIRKGETVLIHAAAGGVGTIAVQLARAWGATVIGTASPYNHDYLRSLGAIPVTYGEGFVERVRKLAPNGVDAAFDAAGEEALRASVELVTDRKRIGTIASFELSEKLGTVTIYSDRNVSRLFELIRLYEQGLLRVFISKSYPLHQAAEAHRAIETRHVRGKIVLLID